MDAATDSQKAALKWLKNRSGDGVFDKNQVLTACGERAPVMRSTWTRLERLGLVERYMNNRRMKITEAGSQVDLRNVMESQA
jgi:hypothetical protein